MLSHIRTYKRKIKQVIFETEKYGFFRLLIVLNGLSFSKLLVYVLKRNRNVYKNVDYKYIVESQSEFTSVVMPFSEKIKKLQNEYLKANGYIMKKKMDIGLCEVCNKTSIFNIDEIEDKEGNVNWRETLRCGYCGLNNRERMMWKKIVDLQIKREARVYVSERLTPFYLYLKHIFPQCIGSEYFPNICNGERNNAGILNEDIMNLSFEDELFDLVICRDVLEHVHDYRKALSEMCRVLKNDGILVVSVPLKLESYNDEVRTIYENGIRRYVMEPEIHGNPIDCGGSLVYTIPGWEMIDYMKYLFKTINCEFVFSIEKGYFADSKGIPQYFLVARK